MRQETFATQMGGIASQMKESLKKIGRPKPSSYTGGIDMQKVHDAPKIPAQEYKGEALGASELLRQEESVTKKFEKMAMENTGGATKGYFDRDIETRSQEEKDELLIENAKEELREQGLPEEIAPIARMIHTRQVWNEDESKDSDLIRHSENIIRKPELISDPDNITNKEYYESEVEKLGDELKIIDYFITHTPDLQEGEIEQYREYESKLRHLQQLGGEIASADLGTRGRELARELSKVQEELTTLYDKINPLTSGEKFAAKNLHHIEDGEVVANEDEDTRPYAWERENAISYDLVRMTDGYTGQRFDLLFFTTRGDGTSQGSINWEVVDNNGSRVDIPENMRMSIPLPPWIDITRPESEEKLREYINEILAEKQELGYSFESESEDLNDPGTPLPDAKVEDTLDTQKGTTETDLFRETVRLNFKNDRDLFPQASGVI